MDVIAIEGNGARPSHRGGGYREDGRCFTLNTVDRHCVCYSIDAISSNSMKSKNPYSGFHETNIVKCIDTQCLNPSCNQGGVVVLMYDGQNCQTSYKVTSTLQCKPDDHHIPVVCLKERAGCDGGQRNIDSES